MRKAFNVKSGVSASIVVARKKIKAKKYSTKTKRENVEICMNCPYASCKHGICNYYKEHSV